VAGKSRAGELEELKSFVAGLVVEGDGGPDLEAILSRPCGFCLKIMQGDEGDRGSSSAKPSDTV